MLKVLEVGEVICCTHDDVVRHGLKVYGSGRHSLLVCHEPVGQAAREVCVMSGRGQGRGQTYCPPSGRSSPMILSCGWRRAVYTSKLAGDPVHIA